MHAQDAVRYNRDIRAILSDNCFYCHGPDRNKRQADLRLDTIEGLHGEAGNPGAIVPGDPSASQLMQRVLSADPDERMPPPESGKSLSPEQIELLRRWIQEGGQFEGHWAFMPREHSSVLSPTQGKPLSDLEASARLDAWIERGLKSQNLSMSPEADPITLLRRLHFDLTGLPPNESDVAEYLRDQTPGAYERLVDRLLASPHFGERMAIWWLDLVRYADSVGYHGDQEVSVSPFREYVIESFNQNKPFDRFTIEQLAGDLLPDPTREQRIASGYNRLGMMSAEGGVQEKEYLAKYMAERVRNATGTWLGITLGCAECHDHKFDPLTTKDFYRFGAFFADIKERGLYAGANDDGNWGPSIPVPTAEQEAKLQTILAEIAATKQEMEASTPEMERSQTTWESQLPHWLMPEPASVVSQAGVTLTRQSDGSYLASGSTPLTDAYTVTIRGDSLNGHSSAVTAIRLDVLPDPSLPKQGPGRASNGNFVLTEMKAELMRASGEKQAIRLQNPSATYEQTGAAGGNPYGKWSIASAVDLDEKGPQWGWAVMERVGAVQSAVFQTSEILTLGPDDSLVITLEQKHEASPHTIGRFRLSVADSSVADSPVPLTVANSILPERVQEILALKSDQRTGEQAQELATYYRSIAPELEPSRQRLETLERERKELTAQMTTTLVTVSVPPRMVRVLPRGNWMDDGGEPVTAGIPEIFVSTSRLPNETNAPSAMTRMDLARWIVHPDNPLTTRALSNRLWKQFFGSGLSRKLDDLGAQGEWPSHPELLDEISQWWIDVDWDIKRWIKLIVMSKTYRQASNVSESSRQLDPYNRFLARQSAFRLDAEFVRDNALAISGLLVTRVGGRSVRPYQPPGYWAYLNFPQREWQNGNGDELYRRGLYTHWQRQYLHPSLLVFDAPNREECTADRPRSNTPLQSLALLNDPSYVEAARTFAELILRHEGDDTQRMAYAVQRTLSRPISLEESTILQSLLDNHRREYQENTASAKDIGTNGARPAATDLDPVELAAWTSVARTLLNLHETITRY